MGNTGEFCLRGGLSKGTHFCVYLLGTDMEMNTPGGYEQMNWETGYGDWLARPDWSTLRVIPWLEKTAMVLCDVADDETGLPSVLLRAIFSNSNCKEQSRRGFG